MGLLDDAGKTLGAVGKALGTVNKALVKGFAAPKHKAVVKATTKTATPTSPVSSATPTSPVSSATPTPPVGPPQEGAPTVVPPETVEFATIQGPNTSWTQDTDLSSASVSSPPAPLAYQGLQVGPDLSIEYEPNIGIPISAANAMLRKLSPFMIRVEPPGVYGEQGGFINQQANSINVNAFGGARAAANFDTARAAIRQSGLGALNIDAGSIQEFMAVNRQRNVAQSRQMSQETPINGGPRLGEPAIADLYAAVDIAWQLAASVKVPPLVLLINPTSLQIQYTKMQQYTDRTRFGYVFHAWGEEQPKLSITARCGAFISGGRGVQFASRRDSAAWQNLMNVFHLYRSNGYIYDTVGKSNAHHFVGALSIHYDGWIYYGHIESFTFGQEDTNQHGGIEFSIEFTASAISDTNQPSFAVQPMRSVTPSPNDARYLGLENRGQNKPGEFSVGFNEDETPRLTTQGHDVGAGDALFSLVPQNVVSLGRAAPQVSVGRPVEPVGSLGFQNSAPSSSGQRDVAVADPSQVDPFRVT